MHALEIQEQARLLIAAHGQKAIAEAAQNAIRMEREGRDDEARDWRRIEAAVALLAGPRAS